MISQSQHFAPDASEKVELFISCRGHLNPNYLSSNNFQVKLYTEQNGQYIYSGETESSQHQNPDFSKTFILDYFFEVNQKLKFEVVDIDSSHHANLIGEVYTTLGTIIGASQQATKAGHDIVYKGSSVGKLMVRFEKVSLSSTIAKMTFQAQITKSNEGWLSYLWSFFSSSNDLVLKLFRITNDFDYVPIYESRVVQGSLNPAWDRFEIKIGKLCNNDYFRPIKARVYSRYGNEDTLLGECQFTLDELTNNEMRRFTLVDPNDKSNAGTLNLTEFNIIEQADFLDYIRGGTQLNVIVGVDFTASNGDPDMPDSLHAVNFDGRMNEYEKAISSVCNILLDYDYDKKVLMFGFGGKPRFPNFFSNGVQHCFPMTGIVNNGWVSGLNEIMNTYRYALQNVDLSGPTLFAPMLQEAMKIAQTNKNNGSQEYTILLIITDGEIHDMQSTINGLIKSAQLPLSVIIVGVGSADFENMRILDGDEGLYNNEGVKAQRDLVQFVPFSDFQNNAEELAKHVLEEVPTQLVEYMTTVGIKPTPPPQFDISHIMSHSQSYAPVNFERGAEPSAPSLSTADDLDVNAFSTVIDYRNNKPLNFSQNYVSGNEVGHP